MNAYNHACVSASKFGGHDTDYYEIHNWFDSTKGHTGDFTHQALRHHSQGVEAAVTKFGPTLITSTGEDVSVRDIVEDHIITELGFIPTIQDWLRPIKNNPEPWMYRNQSTAMDIRMAIDFPESLTHREEK